MSFFPSFMRCCFPSKEDIKANIKEYYIPIASHNESTITIQQHIDRNKSNIISEPNSSFNTQIGSYKKQDKDSPIRPVAIKKRKNSEMELLCSQQFLITIKMDLKFQIKSL